MLSAKLIQMQIRRPTTERGCLKREMLKLLVAEMYNQRLMIIHDCPLLNAVHAHISDTH